MTHRFTTDGGTVVILEESHDLPIVDVDLVLRTGSTADPEGLDGLTRVTFRTLRHGTRRLRGPEVEEAISALGARLSIQVSHGWVRLSGAVIRRNLGPFLSLLGTLIRRPAFRKTDLDRVRREVLSDLVALRDHDRALVGRAFRAFLFRDHPYGRPVVGRAESIGSIRRDDVVACYEGHAVADNAVLGAAGDVRPDELADLVERHVARAPGSGPAHAPEVRPPRMRRGRRVLVVDKPDRAQAQILIGTLGLRTGDRHYYPFLVADTAFGGTFTSRLMQEVREKRGWSYGAYSRLRTGRQRDAWLMWTAPRVDDALGCIRLELDLLERLLSRGPTVRDHRFAKRFLRNSHCFDLDTPSKRLEPWIDEEVERVPRGFFVGFDERVRAVTRADSAAAVRRLSGRDLAIVLVATADRVADRIGALPGVRSVDVVPHHEV